MNHVGIDVSHKELVVVVSVEAKARKAKTFENTAAGHQALIELLAKLKGGPKFVLKQQAFTILTWRLH
jgi:transposase